MTNPETWQQGNAETPRRVQRLASRLFVASPNAIRGAAWTRAARGMQIVWNDSQVAA